MQNENSPFGHGKYIKATERAPDFSYTDPLPFFRRVIQIEQEIHHAELLVQAPGFAKFYINGTSVTEDIFISATSDYDKILWYHTYDVTALLSRGANVLGVIAGNGFFNESFPTAWDFDTAPWRDAPQFLLCLRVNGEIVAVSDESWKASLEVSHVTFSHLRSGEYVDMRKYDPSWLTANYNDSAWRSALPRTRPITAVFKPIACQPVRECARLAPLSIKATEDGAFVADFGQTISGYAEITLHEAVGSEILLYYAEEMDENGHPQHNGMDGAHFYPATPFQHCRLIASGGEDRFKPLFYYGGFRYLRMEGLTQPPLALQAIFTHQAVERRAAFDCDNEVLNYIYRAGIQSTYSNLFWCLTDCPTREKLGWTNDAAASTEQVLINFDILPLFEKWFEDIKYSMFANGSLHGTVPAPDWAWGHECGPVCDSLLFEMPYRVYLYTGRADMLLEGIPYFERYMTFLEKKLAVGHKFALGDWKSNDVKSPELSALIAKLYLLKAYDVTALALRLAGKDPSPTQEKARTWREQLAKEYLSESEECVINMQTAVAMLLHFKIGKSRSVLAKQLVTLIGQSNYQLRAGMVGFQYIYRVLSDIGRGDLAYRLLTETEPGYKTWLAHGATTLWEDWNGASKYSHNHHMYSGVIAWFFGCLLGIAPTQDAPGFEKIELKPLFIRSLGRASAAMDTVRGRIEASWAFRDGCFAYTVTIPATVTAFFEGKRLKAGENVFIISDTKE